MMGPVFNLPKAKHKGTTEVAASVQSQSGKTPHALPVTLPEPIFVPTIQDIQNVLPIAKKETTDRQNNVIELPGLSVAAARLHMTNTSRQEMRSRV